MSDENNGTQDQPRPVKDMKGLLRFCMEATRREDAPNSIVEPMPEDKKKWLEEALDGMSVKPAERMRVCMKIIEEAEVDTEQGTDEQIKAVTELQDWVEDIDIAGDFIKIHGLRIVPKLLSSEVSELRWRCLELLANLSQNNPFAQTAVLTLKLLAPMLLLLNTDPHPTVRVKALYAINSLVRGNPEAQQQLLAQDGLSVLVQSLHSEDEKLRIKATVTVSSLSNSSPTLKDTLVSKGCVEQLLQLLMKEDHGQSHEHFMSALLAMVTDHAAAREKCLNSEQDVKSFLCKRIRFLEGQPPFEEEKEYAERLLEILNTPPAEAPASANKSMAVMAV